MKTPLLSIGIATYNRPHAMKRLLESMTGQVIDGVEVLVRDDSTDNKTEEIVRHYGKLFPIEYFHGKKEGLDEAVLFLTERGSGKYMWWLGDDALMPGAISGITKFLLEHPDASFVWVNHLLMPSERLALDMGGDHFFCSNEEALEKIVGGLGFISATIFDRKLALPCFSKARLYNGSAFVNLYVILYVLSQHRPSYFLQGPFLRSYPLTSEEIKTAVLQGNVLSRSSRGDGIRNDGFEVFGVTFRKVVLEFRGAFKRTAIRKMISKNFSHVWKGILVGWVGGWDSPRGKRIRMLRYYWSHPGAWVALIFMILPRSLNSFLYRFYLVAKKAIFHE